MNELVFNVNMLLILYIYCSFSTYFHSNIVYFIIDATVIVLYEVCFPLLEEIKI